MFVRYWWSEHGPFRPWKECPSRPNPGEVLIFCLNKRCIREKERVNFLSDLLELQKSMVYKILKGEGLDTISRNRLLVKALKIHPPLLGIDAKFYPIERHAYWWQAYGFQFQADAQGYPLISEVVAYLRTQRTQIIEDGKVKIWSQEDLGDATGLKKETVYRMEHDKNPLVLESLHRRFIVASALSTLSKEKEPTIFRLFGLEPLAYRIPVPVQDIVPEVHFLPERLTDEMLRDYQEQQATLFREYFTCRGQNTEGVAHEWLRRGPSLMTKAVTTMQRVNLLALQSRYHGLILGVAREQRKTNIILSHADKAVGLAEQAMRLPNAKVGDSALALITNELLVAALLWRADASYERENYDQALSDIDRALSLLPALQSSQLKIHVAADAGLIHASTAKSETDQALVLSYFNLAAQINASSQLQSHAPHDPFVCPGAGLLYLRKAMALMSPSMEGATGDRVSDLLKMAQRLTPPELRRQHVLIGVFQAKAAFRESDYGLATELALSALQKSRLICSLLNRDRIEELYSQLLNTCYRDHPCLAYLGMKLRTWDHEMD